MLSLFTLANLTPEQQAVAEPFGELAVWLASEHTDGGPNISARSRALALQRLATARAAAIDAPVIDGEG
jgi:hypothetical protein